MTYKQAFDKITEAYIKGEIKPMEPNFCFCGTLNNNDESWLMRGKHFISIGGYTKTQLMKMEAALLMPLTKIGVKKCGRGRGNWSDESGSESPLEDAAEYENLLFAGMSAALDVLKQIHIERGEIIDEVPEFVKRELV